MQFLFKLFPILLFSCFTIISCGVEDEVVILPVIPDCETTVTYYSPHVCNQTASAAAVTLPDSSLLIISNFFDFADSTIMENQSLNIDYGIVDSTLFNSGALCGPVVVAPVTEITCFTLN